MLTKTAAAQPVLTTLHSFTGSVLDGCTAVLAPTLSSAGVLFGTTRLCGTSNNGIAYALTPPAMPGGTWTESVYSFPGGSGGSDPNSTLLIGPGGLLYGVTEKGGSDYGVVFQLEPPAAPSGTWAERVIHTFKGGPHDGAHPLALVGSRSGVLYGLTFAGGATGVRGKGAGTLFTLTPPAARGEPWKEAVLYSFTGGNDGDVPESIAIGSDGILYGVTHYGGTHKEGTVFSFTPPTSPGGPWTEAVLYNFTGGSDGNWPVFITIGAGGVPYGTTEGGGATDNGIVFSLTPPVTSGNPWTETILYTFLGGSDGGDPASGVRIGPGGVLYGTTEFLGDGDNGTVFSLQP